MAMRRHPSLYIVTMLLCTAGALGFAMMGKWSAAAPSAVLGFLIAASYRQDLGRKNAA